MHSCTTSGHCWRLNIRLPTGTQAARPPTTPTSTTFMGWTRACGVYNRYNHQEKGIQDMRRFGLGHMDRDTGWTLWWMDGWFGSGSCGWSGTNRFGMNDWDRWTGSAPLPPPPPPPPSTMPPFLPAHHHRSTLPRTLPRHRCTPPLRTTTTAPRTATLLPATCHLPPPHAPFHFPLSLSLSPFLPGRP